MKLFFLFSALFLIIRPSYPQCSDAGVCSIGGISESGLRNKIAAGYYYGYSGKDDDVKFSSIFLNGDIQLFGKTSLTAEIPYNFQSGPLGEISGIGDILLLLNQVIIEQKHSSLSVSIGGKLASGKDNQGDSLPQIYQSGLGSNDLLLGVSGTVSNFFASVGFQKAGDRNDNYLKLKRGDDILVRAGYRHNISKFILSGELLLIKRLKVSSIIDTTSIEEKFIDVTGSDQTQLNLLINLYYNFTTSYGVQIASAFPFLKRDNNIDGLTRAYTFSAGVFYSF